MTELFSIILLALGGFVTLVALLTTLVYLIPAKMARAQQILAARPGRSFIIGLVNVLFFGVLAALFSQGGDAGGLLASLILLALLAIALVGLGGALLLLRARFYPPHEETGHSLLAVTTRTAVMLTASLLAPVAGWFILAPILLVTGLGAGIISILRRNTAVTTPLETQ